MPVTLVRTTIACAALAALLPAPAAAAERCVGPQRSCFDTLQQAVGAARAGDTIRIAPGVYRGPITIGVSVHLRGAGAASTRIRGGGPVLTIGAPATVTISGVTISDGVTTAATIDGVRVAHLARGGGVLIAPSATVTIADSTIERNAVAPAATVPSPGNKPCPGGPCRFAGGYGGGIWSAGDLTLVRTVVRDNRNGSPVASDAEGGGIFSDGPLTLIDSEVVGNDAHAVPPVGRFATGGGIFSHLGGITLRRSTIAGNRAVLEASWPASVQQGNIGGGLFVDGGSTATIDRSRISGNELLATNSVADAGAFSGGVHGNGPVVIRDSVIASNHVAARAPGTASADSGAGNLNAASTIAGSRLVGNTATAVGGTAIAAAGALFGWSDDTIDVRDSVVAANRVTATGRRAVTAFGGGVVNADVLALRRTEVTDNRIVAAGPAGAAQGGGIWNAQLPDAPEFTPLLTLLDSVVAGNAILAGRGIAARGGGLFTSEPFTLTRTRIRGNAPDQCDGC